MSTMQLTGLEYLKEHNGFQITAADLRKRDGAFYAKLRKHCGWEELL